MDSGISGWQPNAVLGAESCPYICLAPCRRPESLETAPSSSLIEGPYSILIRVNRTGRVDRQSSEVEAASWPDAKNSPTKGTVVDSAFAVVVARPALRAPTHRSVIQCIMQFSARGSVGLVVALFLTQAGLATGQEWASSVVSFTPGVGDLSSVDLISNFPCRGSYRPLDLNDAIGPPDEKFVSIGDEGIIVLTFPHRIEDRDGPDLRVWVSCNIVCEPAIVSASQDGLNFVFLGNLDTFPYGAYDLAGTGLSSVVHVKVQDLAGIPEFCQPGIGLATDVDTAESLYPDKPVPVVPFTWGVIKSIYR